LTSLSLIKYNTSILVISRRIGRGNFITHQVTSRGKTLKPPLQIINENEQTDSKELLELAKKLNEIVSHYRHVCITAPVIYSKETADLLNTIDMKIQLFLMGEIKDMCVGIEQKHINLLKKLDKKRKFAVKKYIADKKNEQNIPPV